MLLCLLVTSTKYRVCRGAKGERKEERGDETLQSFRLLDAKNSSRRLPSKREQCLGDGVKARAARRERRVQREATHTHLHRLIHVSNVLGVDVGVLLSGVDELRERREQALDADPRHVHELTGHEGCGREARGEEKKRRKTSGGGKQNELRARERQKNDGV